MKITKPKSLMAYITKHNKTMKIRTDVNKCLTLLLLAFFIISCSKQVVTPSDNSGSTPTLGNDEIVLDGVWVSYIDDIQFISFDNGRYSLYYQSILSNGRYSINDKTLTLSDDFTGKKNTITIKSCNDKYIDLSGKIIQIDGSTENSTPFNACFKKTNESVPCLSLSGLTIHTPLSGLTVNHGSYLSYIRFESDNQLYKYCQETHDDHEIFATSHMFYVYRHDYVIAKKTHEMSEDKTYIYNLTYTGNLVTGFNEPNP